VTQRTTTPDTAPHIKDLPDFVREHVIGPTSRTGSERRRAPAESRQCLRDGRRARERLDQRPGSRGSVGAGSEPPPRTFNSLDQAIEEVTMARVWGGMHYEVSGRHGVDIGSQIGNYVFANKLRPKH
jgi:hypothetical protein